MNNEKIVPINWIEWLPKDKYYISDLGNMYNNRGKPMSINYQKNGYGVITLRDVNMKTHQVMIHKLVLQGFNPNNNTNLICSHINGDASDNRLVNLKWDTIKNALKNRDKRIAENKSNNININNIDNIKNAINMIKTGENYKDVYLKTGINKLTLNNYMDQNNIERPSNNYTMNNKLNPSILFDLVLGFCFNRSNNELADDFGFSNPFSIKSIRNCETYENQLKDLGYTKITRPFIACNDEFSILDTNKDNYYTDFKEII